MQQNWEHIKGKEWVTAVNIQTRKEETVMCTNLNEKMYNL